MRAVHATTRKLLLLHIQQGGMTLSMYIMSMYGECMLTEILAVH